MTTQTRLRPAPANAGFALRPERACDRMQVEALIDAAFGPGRFAKTAERLREGNAPRLDLSTCAWADERLVGAVRLWPVRIGGAPAVFLGPIAVDAQWRRHGIGQDLVNHACRRAEHSGERAVLLVGDPPFFGPLGFRAAPSSVIPPGPVDPARLMWRELREGCLMGLAGRVTARTSPLPPEPGRA